MSRIALVTDSTAMLSASQAADRGVTVVPHRPRDPFFSRHPRTFVGRSATGTVVLVAIDGRRTSSVGTTTATLTPP